MARSIITPTTVTSAALALVAASAGCGTDEQLSQTRPVHTARPTAAQTAEQTIARRLDGLYTAPITGPELREALPGIRVPAGTWALRIDVGARTLRLTPPEGGDITLRVIGADSSRLRLAPDTACESRAGRTTASQFAWSRTEALMRLQTVRGPCGSDATVLTIAPWRASWPTTPLATGSQPGST
jgi:hypothetical protein